MKQLILVILGFFPLLYGYILYGPLLTTFADIMAPRFIGFLLLVIWLIFGAVSVILVKPKKSSTCIFKCSCIFILSSCAISGINLPFFLA